MSRTEIEHTQAWEESTQEEYDLPAEPAYAEWVKLLTTLIPQWPLMQACQVKLI
jgi:hypothetical protein